MNELRRCEEWLAEQGYTLLRRNGKHRVYIKNTVKIILPTGNVTSHRFFNYLQQRVRHAELAAGIRQTLKG